MKMVPVLVKLNPYGGGEYRSMVVILQTISHKQKINFMMCSKNSEVSVSSYLHMNGSEL